MNKQQQVSYKEAAYEVELACRRLALLHLAYAKTLIKELGEEEGKDLILKSIKAYGQFVGEQVKERVKALGLENTPENYGQGPARTLPKFGMNDGVRMEKDETGEEHRRVYGCVMAKVWRELGEEELGNLYCYIDTAKYMYYNSDYKLTHRCTMPAHGKDYCEFALEQVSEKEKEDFFEDRDWRYLDKNITLEDK